LDVGFSIVLKPFINILTNFMKSIKLKNEGSLLLAQNEVQADIFFRFFGSKFLNSRKN